MNEQIMFSIVIPAYNAACYVDNCLDSVLKQTYLDFEIIIVNDGSNDNTEKKILEYKEKHSNINIIYLSQKNAGVAAARHKGIEYARGMFVAFLDVDDIWYDNKLETVAKWIQQTNADVFYSDENEVDLQGKKRKINYRQLTNDALSDLIINGNQLSTSTVVAKTSLLKKNNAFGDGKQYGEDIACWIGLAEDKATFKHIPIPLGEYRRVQGSLTISNIDYLKKTDMRLIDFYDKLDKCKYSKKEIQSLKQKQKSKNEYKIARYYHQKQQYADSRKYYVSALKTDNCNYKAFAGFILALLKIRK